MQVSEEKRNEAVDYGLDSIRYICDEIGPRESGTPSERKAQEWLKSELLSNGWADEAEIETFKVARHGLVGFTKIAATLMLFSVALQFIMFFLPYSNVALAFKIISLAIAAFTAVMVVCEFLLYLPFVDPLLEKTESANVYAKYRSSGETTKRIVFSGHCDSAYEWTLMKIKPAFMIACLAISIVGLVAAFAVAIAQLATGGEPLACLIVSAVFIPAYVSLYWFCRFKVVVPGANDNLTGVLASVGVLKCLKESGIRFEHTEVAVLLTGSEEAGLRGASAWARAHKQEIEESGVDTVYVGLETLRDWDYMSIYVKDMTSTVTHDAGAVKLLDKASAAVGRPLEHANVFFGASDAAAVTKAGLRATCLTGMDPTPAAYYHNCKDTPDNMDKRSFALGLDVAIEAAEIFDRDGAEL